MNPESFLNLAKSLASSQNAGPSENRTAISRCYYFAYHLVRTFIEDELSIPVKGAGGRDNLHLLLQQYLLNCGVDEAMQAGRVLADLHEHRKIADYDLRSKKAEASPTTLLCIARSTNLEQILKNCSAAPLRDRVLAGLTQYKKLRQGLS